MILLYFKQAWNLIKQEKLFSSIYIIGTGLSITAVMALFIVGFLKVANIYPENNRDRLLIVTTGQEKFGKGNSNALLSHTVIETCFYPLKTAESVTAMHDNWNEEEHHIQLPGRNDNLQVAVKYIDTHFWTVFPFRFIDGNPFSEADMQSGIHTAVIAESLAKKVFGKTDVTGEYIHLDQQPYRICGVVKDASYITERTYAHLWIPYTVDPGYKENSSFGKGGSLGSMSAYVLAPTRKDMDKVAEEINSNIQRYSSTLIEGVTFSILGQPDRHWQSLFRIGNLIPDFNKIILQYVLIICLLLLVPAISLSGMTHSRMERRLSEMGVRRAFGAPAKTLMEQVITENFLFTLFGGAVGLVFFFFLYLYS